MSAHPKRRGDDMPRAWHDTAPILWSMYAALCLVVAMKFALWFGWLQCAI
jgi:hypothetical protein